MCNRKILHAYRHVYRRSLRAIQYASPARHTLRKLIDTEFRLGTKEDYDPDKIRNTLQFLEGAIESRGLEHRIVKGLLHVWSFGGSMKHMKPEYG